MFSSGGGGGSSGELVAPRLWLSLLNVADTHSKNLLKLIASIVSRLTTASVRRFNCDGSALEPAGTGHNLSEATGLQSRYDTAVCQGISRLTIGEDHQNRLPVALFGRARFMDIMLHLVTDMFERRP